MKKMINKVSEKGLTLVEILASIFLVSIILSAFFSFFIQSAKTGKTSEEVVDGTYIAQGEMEKVYEISRKGDLTYGIDEIVNRLSYEQLPPTTPNEHIFSTTQEEFYIKLKLKDHSYPGMSYLVIEVFKQGNGTRPRAKMETILEWGS